jgi:hypothetical protein
MYRTILTKNKFIINDKYFRNQIQKKSKGINKLLENRKKMKEEMKDAESIPLDTSKFEKTIKEQQKMCVPGDFGQS